MALWETEKNRFVPTNRFIFRELSERVAEREIIKNK